MVRMSDKKAATGVTGVAACAPMKLTASVTSASSPLPARTIVYAANGFGPSSIGNRYLLFTRYEISSMDELFKNFKANSYCVDIDHNRDVRIWNDGQQLPKQGHGYVFVCELK